MNKKSLVILLTSLYASSILAETFEPSAAQLQMLEQLPPDQRASVLGKMESGASLQDEIQETFEEASNLVLRPELQDLASPDQSCPECIYGYSFFQYSPTTFAPVDNSPVNPDYIIGPGDNLEVNFYGSAQERKVKVFVNRESKVVLPYIGPINFLGMTYQEAFEAALENFKFLQNMANGGRAGYMLGGSTGMAAPQQTSQTIQESPTQDLTYAELRSRLPNSISDQVVQLLANSKQALLDFAEIRTQQDVDQFNQQYDVTLTLPQEG